MKNIFLTLILLICFPSEQVFCTGTVLDASYLNSLGFNNESNWITVIDNTNISSVDPNVFKGYNNLQMVDIFFNSLKQIDLQVFKDAIILNSLIIGGRQLSQVTNVKKLRFNQLQALTIQNPIKFDSNVVNALTNLNSASISFTSALKKNQLKAWSKVTSLDIRTFNQKTLTRHILAGLSSLNWLNFEGSNITNINKDTFYYFYKLNFLDLSSNLLTSWKNNQLNEVSSLLLSNNKLSSFKQTVDCKVNTLDLSKNKFTSFKSVHLTECNNLTDLFMGENPLADSYQSISQLQLPESVQKIHLNTLNLAVLNATLLQNMKNITEINFAINKIAKIEPRTFIGFSSLEVLNLNNNELTEIDNSTFIHLNMLQSIYLSDNQLSYIAPGAFANLKNLEEVFLDNNKLQQLDSSTFKGCTNLKMIYLLSNPILSNTDLQNLCPTSACQVYH